MRNMLSALVLSGLLGACSSSGGLVGESETYKGPQTAAVTPVSDRRPLRDPSDDRLGTEIQRNIQHQLDRSGIFAGVIALDRPDEGNEAEVIIEPTLTGPLGYGEDHPLELWVRVAEKTKHRVVFEERYQTDAPTEALHVALKELEDDLEDRYVR